MEAIKFKESNSIYGKEQDQYTNLPAHINKFDPTGQLTTCWKFTLKERLKLLFTGVLYLQILTFRKPLQPLKMSLSNPLKSEGKNG